MKKKALTLLTITALIVTQHTYADMGSNDSDDDDILAPQVIPESQIVPTPTPEEEAPLKGGVNPSGSAEPV